LIATEHPRRLLAPLLLLLPMLASASPPTVLEPAGNDDRVPTGYDFATQELGDPWDMDRLEDTFTPNADDIVNESIERGIYSFDSVEDGNTGVSDAKFWLIHPGLNNTQRLVSESRNPLTGRRLFTREKHPIDTAQYRYLTARVRMTSATAAPLTGNQRFIVYYFEDATSIGNALFGSSSAFLVPPNEWTIVHLDLATEFDPDAPEKWSQLPKVEGLRIDPTSKPDVHVEVDWIRLTAEPGPEEYFTVDWSGNGAPEYVISASAEGVADAVAYELATGVAGTAFDVSLSVLPPGNYRIEVSGAGETGASPGVVLVNDPPLIDFSAPNIKGDQSLGFGAMANSNHWSEIDVGDIDEVLDFEYHSFAEPVGSFAGRPTGNTSRLLMNVPVPIDTAYYRMLCFESEIKGPIDIGAGSVTKVLWGNKRADLTTPSPVIAREGLNEYCVGDMTALRIDPFSPPEAEGAWVGPINNIRFDPHEFPRSVECTNNPSPEACRDVRLDSFVLAPFHRANPTFTFRWSDSDADDDAEVEIWLDDDRIPGNTKTSTEHHIGSATENDAADSLLWMPAADIQDGTWNVYGVISDGFNTTLRYAGGPLVKGSPPVAAVRIAEPDGISDMVVAGAEYGLHQRKDPWDMDSHELNLALARNIDSVKLAGGLFSGTASSNASQFILMTTNEGDSEINPADYRYITMKMRLSGVTDTHFVQVFFSTDPGFDPPTAGFTSGIPVSEGEWSLVTFDLATGIHPNSPATWLGSPAVRSIRIDPTTKSGTQIEIDWITLSAPPQPSTAYTVRWAAENTGTSTFDLSLVDTSGHQFPLATGLPSTQDMFTVNLSHLILGGYFIRLTASPGPSALSPGAIRLVEELPDVGGLFEDSFE
jgi:hypothetical protein